MQATLNPVIGTADHSVPLVHSCNFPFDLRMRHQVIVQAASHKKFWCDEGTERAGPTRVSGQHHRWHSKKGDVAPPTAPPSGGAPAQSPDSRSTGTCASSILASAVAAVVTSAQCGSKHALAVCGCHVRKSIEFTTRKSFVIMMSYQKCSKQAIHHDSLTSAQG